MGLDADYQAIPAASRILTRLREDVSLRDWANMAPLWIRGGLEPSPWAPEPPERAVRQLVEELLRAHPDLPRRHCTLDRAWDVLHHLLSANRRDEAGTAGDALADAAIQGEEPVAEHVRGMQGVPMRYTPPETVRRIAHHLESLVFDELVSQGHARLLADPEVYKGPVEGSQQELREWLSPYFEALRAFYRTAASHGDGVLVSLD